MVSAAKSITFASLMSLCELNTHWMKRLGWQLWFMNLAMLPTEPASMQYSGVRDATSKSCSEWSDAMCRSEPALCCRKKTIKQHCDHLSSTMKRSSPAFSKKKTQHFNYACSDTTWHFDKGKEWQCFSFRRKIMTKQLSIFFQYFCCFVDINE
jgi:hypothetical protein